MKIFTDFCSPNAVMSSVLIFKILPATRDTLAMTSSWLDQKQRVTFLQWVDIKETLEILYLFTVDAHFLQTIMVNRLHVRLNSKADGGTRHVTNLIWMDSTYLVITSHMPMELIGTTGQVITTPWRALKWSFASMLNTDTYNFYVFRKIKTIDEWIVNPKNAKKICIW